MDLGSDGRPHTVTFNSGKPELSDFVPGPTAGQLVAGPAFFPMGPASPVSNDGTQQISSGVPTPGGTYAVTFTKTGLFGYVCSFHPGMRGQIEVREAGAPHRDTGAGRHARAGDAVELARPDAERGGAGNVGHGGHGGHGAHRRLAGLGDGFGITALAFLPGNITVRRGDVVSWVLADPFELHTITFLSGATPPDLLAPGAPSVRAARCSYSTRPWPGRRVARPTAARAS